MDKVIEAFKNKEFPKDKKFVALPIWNKIVAIVRSEIKNNPPLCKDR